LRHAVADFGGPCSIDGAFEATQADNLVVINDQPRRVATGGVQPRSPTSQHPQDSMLIDPSRRIAKSIRGRRLAQEPSEVIVGYRQQVSHAQSMPAAESGDHLNLPAANPLTAITHNVI